MEGDKLFQCSPASGRNLIVQVELDLKACKTLVDSSGWIEKRIVMFALKHRAALFGLARPASGK